MARSPEKTPQLENKGYIRRRTPPSVAGACSYGFETHAKRALCATGVLFARMGSGLLSGLIVQGEAFPPKRLKGRPDVVSFNAFWRNGRVVEGTCLENKQGESPRGFKSYFLRQMLLPRLDRSWRGFLLCRAAPYLYIGEAPSAPPKPFCGGIVELRECPCVGRRRGRNIHPRRSTRHPLGDEAGDLENRILEYGI